MESEKLVPKGNLKDSGLPTFDQNNAPDVLQLIYIQLLSIIETMDMMQGYDVRIDNKPIMQHQFKQVANTFLKEVNKRVALFDHYYKATNGVGVYEAIYNEQEVLRTLAFVTVEERGLLMYLVGLAIKKDPIWNNIRASIIQKTQF